MTTATPTNTSMIPTSKRGPRLRLYRARAYRKPSVIVPAAILLFILLACFAGPTLFHLPKPSVGNLSDYLLPIGSPHHLLGTNTLGNDMLSQLLVGGQITIIVSVGAMALGLVFGTLIGMIAGYYERIVGAVLMRILDIIFAFPDIILAVAIAAYLGPSVINTIWAIGFFNIAGFGRIARAQTLRVVRMDFIVAGRSSGISGFSILWTHIWPNIAGRVFAYALIALSYAMMAEASLSFLGLGVPIPTPSWGNIIGSNQSYMSLAPLLIVMPAILLFATIASANLLADGLQEKRASTIE
ncbi:MAG: transporter permease [Microbacteriaceae bacterium]|jgi:peptide/nickel transport system permease protein|nr:transporter permease [Microbacteriaceae bacterium]